MKELRMKDIQNGKKKAGELESKKGWIMKKYKMRMGRIWEINWERFNIQGCKQRMGL